MFWGVSGETGNIYIKNNFFTIFTLYGPNYRFQWRFLVLFWILCVYFLKNIPIALTKSVFSSGFWGVSGDTGNIYIKILLIRFYSLPFHISLCKTIKVSDWKYEHQQTNSTIGSNRSQVGSSKCLLYFLFIYKYLYYNYLC